MNYNHFRRFAALLLPTLALTACTTVDFSEPEMALPSRYSEGAVIRLTSFQGSAEFGASTEGPALSILHDQLTYGMVRCSRSGPALELEIAADFTSRKDLPGRPEHLLGVATWRDPASRQVVGRHHIDVPSMDGDEQTYVRVDDEDGFDSLVSRGQLATGEAFVTQVCEKAFDQRRG